MILSDSVSIPVRDSAKISHRSEEILDKRPWPTDWLAKQVPCPRGAKKLKTLDDDAKTNLLKSLLSLG